MQEHREQIVRVCKNGSVAFVHDHLTASSKIDSAMSEAPSFVPGAQGFPAAATNYGASIADQTRGDRPARGIKADNKAYVSHMSTFVFLSHFVTFEFLSHNLSHIL